MSRRVESAADTNPNEHSGALVRRVGALTILSEHVCVRAQNCVALKTGAGCRGEGGGLLHVGRPCAARDAKPLSLRQDAENAATKS